MGMVLLPAPPWAVHGHHRTRRSHVWLRASVPRSISVTGSVLTLFQHLLLATVGDGTPGDVSVHAAMLRALSTLHYFFSVLVLTKPLPLVLLSYWLLGFSSGAVAGGQPFRSHWLTSSIS